MPSGSNPNSKKNLEKGQKYRFSGENAGKMAQKSAEVRAGLKDISKMLQDLPEGDYKKIANMIHRRAVSGNYKYTELFLKLVGQMPPDQIETTINSPNPFTGVDPEELKEIYYGRGGEQE